MSAYRLGSVYISDELYHHGIKGQKWGVRRYQNTDGSLTSLGQHHRMQREGRSMRYKGSEENDHGEKGRASEGTIRTGVNTLARLLQGDVVGAAMGVGSAVKGSASASMKSSKYKKEREKDPIDPETGFHKKTKEMSEKEDLKRVNPEYTNMNANTKENCVLCTMTYEMRRRGYNVTARKASTGFTAEDAQKMFPKSKKIDYDHPTSEEEYKKANKLAKHGMNIKYAKNVVNKMKENYPDGARGQITVAWGDGGGHSMIFEKKNGQIIIMDGQINKVFKNPEKILKRTWGVSTRRLDDCDFDPSKLKRCCE